MAITIERQTYIANRLAKLNRELDELREAINTFAARRPCTADDQACIEKMAKKRRSCLQAIKRWQKELGNG